MFCSNCGKEIPDNSKFCIQCGAQMTNATSRMPSENMKNKKTVIKDDNSAKLFNNMDLKKEVLL